MNPHGSVAGGVLVAAVALVAAARTGSCHNARAQGPVVATVTTSPRSLTLQPGATARVSAIPRDSAGTMLLGPGVSWTSSDSAVATVTAHGVAATVTALAAGTATVRATAGGRHGSTLVTVSPDAAATAPAPAAAAPPHPPASATAPAPRAAERPPARGASQAFVTPDLLDNASFEDGQPDPWNGFRNGSNGPPRNVTRDRIHARDGAWAIHRVLEINPGRDTGADVFLRGGAFRPVDRLWGRFYFYFDAAPTSPFKFQIYEDAGFNDQWGGLYVNAMSGRPRLAWVFAHELQTRFVNLAELQPLLNGWHSLEVDFWLNGDTSNGGHDYPSVAIWLDGVQITRALGATPAPGRWINGRLNAGERYPGRRQRSTGKLGTYNLVGILNGGNTTPGNVWVDRVSVSTVGRIGP